MRNNNVLVFSTLLYDNFGWKLQFGTAPKFFARAGAHSSVYIGEYFFNQISTIPQHYTYKQSYDYLPWNYNKAGLKIGIGSTKSIFLSLIVFQ